MRVNGYRFPLWLILFIAISGVGAVLSVYLSIRIGFHATNSAQYFMTQFEYEYEIADIHENRVCPGDMIVFDFHINVEHEGPFVARITETFVDTMGKHVIFDTEPMWANQVGPIHITRTVKVEAPDLPAGDYFYRRAAALPPTSGSPAFLEVPFTILANCE